MPKFRSKPSEITAEQWFPDNGATKGVHWERRPGIEDELLIPYVITVHEQRAYLAPGDWIIPEPKQDRFYPCKPDIFAARYEEDTGLDTTQSIYERCASIALDHIYAAPPEAPDEAHVQAEASSFTARTIARKIWQLARGRDPEEQELRASERISAAQELYEEMLSDTSPDDPEYGERVFDAMKAAIAKADGMRDRGVW